MALIRLLVASSVAFTAAFAVMACGSIPNITFVDESAEGAAPDSSTSPNSDGGSKADTGADAAKSDSGRPTTCPAGPPSYADICCGSVPCKGDCDKQCSDCARCGSDEACCARKNSVTCLRRDNFNCNN